MDFFKFGLEQKLDQHSYVEFYGDSDGNGFKAQKSMIDPLIGPNRPKNGIFQTWTRIQKSDLHCCVEFYGNSDGNGFETQKPMIDPLMGPN